MITGLTGSRMTVGGVVSRTIVTTCDVVLPAASLATTLITFWPSLSSTSALYLPSAPTWTSLPFTKIFEPGSVVPVIEVLFLLVGVCGLSTVSAGAVASLDTFTLLEAALRKSFAVASPLMNPISVGLTSNVASPFASVVISTLTPAPERVTFAPATGALVPASLTWARTLPFTCG